MDNVETESNRRRDRQEPITMRSLQKELQSYRVDNERIMKAQEEILQSLNMLQKQVNKDSGIGQEASARKVEVSRSHDRRDDHGGSRRSRSISKHQHQHQHSPGQLTRKTYARSRSASNPSVSPVKHPRRRHGSNSLHGELRKIRPPSFDGGNKKREDAKAWLMEMRKYFQLHDYSSNAEARIAAYHLQRKASMWWDQLKQVKHFDEKRIS
jgi:hypothetical protein